MALVPIEAMAHKVGIGMMRQVITDGIATVALYREVQIHRRMNILEQTQCCHFSRLTQHCQRCLVLLQCP